MMLVHYVIEKETFTTVLAQVLEVHRHKDRNPTLVIRETASGVVHTDVPGESVFPAYPVKDVN